MQFVPYLNFDGTCRDAFAFYAAAFGVDAPQAMTYRDAPAEMCERMPADTLDRVMHTQIEVGDGLLMGADGPSYKAGSGSVVVNAMIETVEEAERIFAALAEGGTVDMPIQETFWAHRWGSLTDRYGKAWMVNCSKPMPG